MPKRPLSYLFLKKKLHKYTYTSGSSLNIHINSFNKLLANFFNLDGSFGDQDEALMLSLSNDYE